jgi:hypothetical protein
VSEEERYRAVLWQLTVEVERHLYTNHGNQHTPQAGPSMGESIRMLRRASKMAREALGEKKFMALRASRGEPDAATE